MNRLLILAVALCSLTTGIALGESGSSQTVPAATAQEEGGRSNPEAAPKDPEDVRAQKDLEKRLNEKRHADLKRDTDKLLQLATELKKYVDETDENVLSMDVIRKAEEIEKLAKSVRTKMRGQ